MRLIKVVSIPNLSTLRNCGSERLSLSVINRDCEIHICMLISHIIIMTIFWDILLDNPNESFQKCQFFGNHNICLIVCHTLTCPVINWHILGEIISAKFNLTISDYQSKQNK
uniref:Uncharacterized protein n=1 Tax=Cacopsylla melanoneura TaxID=428564 RepID=A0A8D8V1E2_9HEMI